MTSISGLQFEHIGTIITKQIEEIYWFSLSAPQQC